MIVFSELKNAIDAGFQVYDRTGSGYLVRLKTARGWVLAVVDLAHKAAA